LWQNPQKPVIHEAWYARAQLDSVQKSVLLLVQPLQEEPSHDAPGIVESMHSAWEHPLGYLAEHILQDESESRQNAPAATNSVKVVQPASVQVALGPPIISSTLQV
jgi:hypothetical protein